MVDQVTELYKDLSHEDVVTVNMSVMKKFGLVPHNAVDLAPVFHSYAYAYHGKETIIHIIQFIESEASFTNDHRTSRYFVSKSMKQLTELMKTNRVAGLILNKQYTPQGLVIEADRRGILQYKHPRKVLTKSMTVLHKEYLAQNVERLPNSLSEDLFKSCVPFYITKADCKEIQYCVCGTCENAHNLYTVLRQMLQTKDSLPDCLSDFISDHLICKTDDLAQWADWCCILRTCTKCKDYLEDALLMIWSLIPADIEKTPKYLRFGKGFNEKYPDKSGCKFDCQDIFEFIAFFETEMKKYVFHRNLLKWTKFHHEIFWLENKALAYMVMDFSENPKQTFLFESQPMYYGKVSITLHNTIVFEWDEEQSLFKKTYIHHVSDDKKHNAAFVDKLIDDVFPLLETENRAVVILSDNCSSQYKCVGAFNFMLSWVHEYGVEIIKTYGIAGHGKSEIDSAGGLVKEALRNAAVTSNDVFYKASDALGIARRHFQRFPGKVTREFHEVDECEAEGQDGAEEKGDEDAAQGEETEELEEHGTSDGCLQLKKLDGSSALHFLHFKKDCIIVSPLVCGCQPCVKQSYADCLYKVPYYTITSPNGKGVLLKKNYSDPSEEDTDSDIEEEIQETDFSEFGVADDDADIDDDDDERINMRRDLVAVGSIVAVATPASSNKNYWIYECLELGEDIFKGLYYDCVKGLSFKKTKQVEEISYGSVIYPAVEFTEKRNFFVMSSSQDNEINQYSNL